MSTSPAAQRKVAVVGGATSGLGAASARALAEAGHDLLLWSRDQARLDATAADLAGTGVTVRTVAADAADPGAAAVVAEAAVEAYGRVDVLVLNAGGPPVARADEVTAEGLRAAFQLLAVTPVDLANRLLPAMRERGWGRVVSIMSSGVREPIDTLAYSNAGRAALAAWMKTLSRTIAGDGVTVNGVLPGRIATPRVASLDEAAAKRTGKPVEDVSRDSAASIPAGRYGRPEELAAVVAFLASDAASYVTGTTIACDGGSLRSLP
ncbi:3-oxoacyl-[acyl-carrier protein] reductase [Microlunatus sagamiharensis]|uniref:3-oxoacyl-[acyl-carrier protein] reductase n=1 Tax=Microlunatus sagamiharensis TaxID=546874 RepID=A0A1H2MLI9_9ACTN|nr:SDR family oxidoreductase [Microlunatus sagamiharensis]SDU94093.1 3-oxoacyl-[acyl-carrier protein] reductase [Microlunatus sagamiharensis]